MSDWLNLDSAPQNGTRFLIKGERVAPAWCDSEKRFVLSPGVTIASYCAPEVICVRGTNNLDTHWRPCDYGLIGWQPLPE